MSYWHHGYVKVRAGEEKWYVPDEPGCYVIEVAAGPEGTLFYVGSSSKMQTYRFYTHHHWMKRFEIVSVRWKESRRRGDYAMEEIRLRWWLGERGKTLNIKETAQPQMAVSVNNQKVVKAWKKGETKLKTEDFTDAGDELIQMLLKKDRG